LCAEWRVPLLTMAKQKTKRLNVKDHTDSGGTGGPPGKKQRRKVRRNRRNANGA
jgi:hypothetical protein